MCKADWIYLNNSEMNPICKQGKIEIQHCINIETSNDDLSGQTCGLCKDGMEPSPDQKTCV